MAGEYIPFSSGPFPTRPYGPLTGIAQADADFMMRQGNIQSLESMFQDRLRKQAELERYQGETPSKLAEAEFNRQMATQKLPAIPELISGEVGKARSEAAKGRFDRDTVDSKIQTQLGVDATTRSKQPLDQHMNMLKFLDAQEPILAQAELQGPLAVQMAWQNIRKQMGASGAGLPQEFTPAVREKLQGLRRHLVESVEHIQKINEIQTQNEGSARNSMIGAEASRDVARINQEGQSSRAQLTAEQKAQANKIEAALAQLFQKSLKAPLTPQEQEAFRIGQQILNNMYASRAAGTAMGFGFMGGNPNPGFPTPTPVAPPGSPQPKAPTPTFRNEAEAIASGIKGEVIINGRRARID